MGGRGRIEEGWRKDGGRVSTKGERKNANIH